MKGMEQMARKKVPTAPRLKSWNEVDQALKEIAECESCLEEITVELNRNIADAKAKAEAQARPAHDRIKQLECDVKEYVTQHRDEIGGKTKLLNFGKTGFRLSTKVMIPSVADVIAAIKRLGFTDCLTVKESVNKDALRKRSSNDILKTGAYLKSTDEFWYETDKEKLKEG